MVISMDRWKGKVAIVTGASAGIGAAIVEQLVEAGLKVAGLARRKEKVEELATKLQGKSGQLYAVRADVSKKEDVLEAFRWVKQNLGPVHILINNAGLVRQTNLIEGDAKFWQEVFNTNVLGLCMATREAVRDMRENGVDGHIVHINSVLGHRISHFPNLNVYGGAKHAVTALTETLRQELNSVGSKIKVSSISPGLVATEIAHASSLGKQTGQVKFSEQVTPRRFQILASGIELTKQRLNYLKIAPILQSADVADAVLYVLATPSHVQVHELMIQPIGADI